MLVIFEMPVELEERYRWLDEILLKEDTLEKFVNELSIIHKNEPTDVPVSDLLGTELTGFLKNGFKAISSINLAVILQHPNLLYGLRTLVYNQKTPKGAKNEATKSH